MKAPRRSTVEYVYAKLKIEVIKFISSEINFNHTSGAEVYGFDAQKMSIYDTLCEDMIRAIEESKVNYEALVEAMTTSEDAPF